MVHGVWISDFFLIDLHLFLCLHKKARSEEYESKEST